MNREAFESLARPEGYGTAKHPTGNYQDERTDMAWEFWQAAQKAATQWRDISEAEFDGSFALVLWDGKSAVIDCLDEDCDAAWMLERGGTHFFPIPDPPRG